MAYERDDILETHKDYKENINLWEFYIRSANGGYDYMVGQYLNRYNLELDNEFNPKKINVQSLFASEKISILSFAFK